MLEIIVDTREKKNHHILNYFDRNNIKYEFSTLAFGDYAAKGYENIIRIERKSGIEEITNNFTRKRNQFINEFESALIVDCKLAVVIEDTNLNNAISHEYRSKMKPESLIASIQAFRNRYNCSFDFISSNHMGYWIYVTLHYGINIEKKMLT